MGHSEGHGAWLGMWFSISSMKPDAETAGWILREGVLRCDSAGWHAGKQQVCGGEEFLHGSNKDSKEQALKDFH